MARPLTARPRLQPLSILWAGVIGLGLLAKLLRGYRPDELQHLHVAWNIGQGLLPYRDFFEHHPPLFHLLLVPLVRLLPQLDARFAVVSALLELAILLLSLWLYGRLLRLSVAPGIAAWGVGAWLLLPPYVFKVFELRPDWLALAALLGALLGVARAVAPGESRSLSRSLLAGLLTGIAVCLTQKAAVLGLGIGVWLLGVTLYAPGGARRARALALLGFSVGVVLPVAALLLIFARYDAVGLLIRHTLLINLGWAREAPWQQGLQDALAASLGLLALGLVEAALIVRQTAEHLRRASVPSLMTLLSGLGLLAYLRSPAPYPQWFLLLVAPWLVYLAVLAVARYVESPAALRADRWPIGLAAGLCAVLLWGTLYRPALLVWVILALVLWRGWRRVSRAAARGGWLWGTLLAPGLLYIFISFALGLALSSASAQAGLERFVAAHARPQEPILVASWPTVAPFHAHGVYDWLFHQGVLDTLAADRRRIEDEYIAAVAERRVRLVLIEPELVDRYLPGFGVYLRAHATPLNDLPANPWQMEAYLVHTEE